LVRL